MRCAVLLAVVFLVDPARAADKKPEADKGNFDDLFGAPPKNANLDAVKKATEGMQNKQGADGLAAKVSAIDSEAAVQLLNVFVAEAIAHDAKLGCQPSGRDKKRIVEFTFDELPAKGLPFDACLTLASKAGREMNMSIAIVDSRNQRVAKAEDVIDFRGRPKIDHVLGFPAPMFKIAGQHYYVVDLDGKEVGRLPLFVLTVKSDATGVPGSSTDSDARSLPVTAAAPDGS